MHSTVGIPVRLRPGGCQHDTNQVHIGDETSCIRFQYDGKMTWLKVYVYKNTENGFRKAAVKMVLLLCASMGIHVAIDEM